MSWETELAMEFKSRNNPKEIGAVIGSVVSIEPFQAAILDGQFILDKSNSYICNQLLERNTTINAAGSSSQKGNMWVNNSPTSSSYRTEGSITIEGDVKLGGVLKKGDLVMIVPTRDNQKFFIVDIVKGV